jgi:hypothetical protein
MSSRRDTERCRCGDEHDERGGERRNDGRRGVARQRQHADAGNGDDRNAVHDARKRTQSRGQHGHQHCCGSEHDRDQRTGEQSRHGFAAGTHDRRREHRLMFGLRAIRDDRAERGPQRTEQPKPSDQLPHRRQQQHTEQHRERALHASVTASRVRARSSVSA